MTSMSSYGPQAATPVRIPSDVEREDRVLANLTARQLAILTVTGLLLYALFAATRTVLPLAVFAVAAVPVAVAAAVVTLGSRDGMSLDRLLVAAARQRLTPRVQVAAPAGIAPAPAWITAHATRSEGTADRVAPSVLHLPAEEVSEAASGAGVIDLGQDGVAALCVCSTVNFALRTPGEQEALVATFGRYLHSLTAPVQILIRTQRLDLTSQIAELRDRAGGLPHPALEQAALEHADYLAQLAHQSDLLRRQVLLVLREPIHTAAGGTVSRLTGQISSSTGSLAVLHRSRRRQARASEAVRHAAETRLARRIGEAVALLSAAGIVVTPLDAAQAGAVLAGACNPDRLIPPTAALATADEIITTDTTDDAESSGWARGWSSTPYPAEPEAASRHVDLDDFLAGDTAGDDRLDAGGVEGGTAGDEMWWAR
jgi:hypothetical protein